MKRSILIIVQNLPVPFDRRVWQEAITLRNAGHRVAVICPKKEIYTKSYEVLEEIEIYRYPLIYEADKGVLGYFFEFAYCWLATLILSIRSYLRLPFSVIHACNPPETYFLLSLLYRPFGVRFVFDHHDLSPEMYLAKGHSEKSFLYKALLILERFTLRTAHKIIEVNESHKEIALKRGGIPESKVTIVRSGPRASWAEMKNADISLKNGKKYLVVYLGEMCVQDGVDYFLHSIKQFRQTYKNDTYFALIGGGPEQKQMRKLAEELDLNNDLLFTGRISDEDLWAYLSTADIGVDPTPWTEWGNKSTMNKVIEYLSFGLPVVTYDLLEHRRSAGDAAIYVNPNDEEEFAQVIQSLLNDPTKRATMSTYGRERFLNQLSWEHSESQLLTLYDSLD